MSYNRERIRALSGKSPSANADQLLDAWLLPGEPVEGALCGAVRLMPTWFVATPMMMFMLRDGMQPSIEYMAPLGMVVGWQAHEGWSGDVKFDLNTSEGMLTLSQVKARFVVAFGQTIEGIAASLSQEGMPAEFQPLERGVAELSGLLTELLRDDAAREAVGDAPPEALVALDVGRALSRALGDAEVISYAYALLLWMLSFAVDLGPQGNNLTRPQRVLAFLQKIEEISPDYAMTTAMRASSFDRQGEWAELITGFAYVIETCAAWLPPSLPASVRHAFDNEARSLRAMVAPHLSVQASAGNKASPQTDDVLARLERLQELRASGALTDDEFIQLKTTLLIAKP